MYRETDYGTIFLPQIAYTQTDTVTDQVLIYIPQINLTGSFDMYDDIGGYIGGATDIVGSLVAGSVTDSVGFTDDGTMQISSVTPFFGILWTAHDISYDFNIEDSTMNIDMMFDWGATQNIEIEMFANVNFNDDGTATITAIDGDYDGVIGSQMSNGPFIGFTAAFNFELSSEDGSAITAESFVIDPYIWPPYPMPDFIDWSYQLDNDSEVVQALNTNDTVVETFTIVATDEHGATDSQEIAVTIHGTDDSGPVVQLIQVRNAELITKAQASIDEYGTDYTAGDTGKLMKFELWLDATELSSFGAGATEIRGYQFDMDWNVAEVGALNFPTIAGDNVGFNAANPANSAITFNSTTGDVAMASSTAIVDTDVSNDGPPLLVGAEKLIGTFYVNPNADLETITLSINEMLVVTDTSNINLDDYSTVIEISSVDATIQTDANNYLDNVTLNYFKDGVDTGVFTLVEGGDITFPSTSLAFDSVKLSDPAAYTSGIAADDAVDVLRDIVHLDELVIGSAAWHAADVNNDGAIQADDAVAVLRHIVHLDEIDTFDLIDNTTGNRVTNLNPDAAEGQWTIVANGDVDQSGGFVDSYVVQVDII
jgi:hypothetical protein